ncbi:DcaP family trimeric outer membrane transporter [Microbulbifer aggregans]|uniref:DcaP family trimeric outer membrane transporter n=1 Tax=Microbulbifer aggregans TaxID=1769779 RepID=UPI001CFF4EDD|nr:DcaP family trimeric outer membrane transporter [Microbulbifer aggregans]
MSVITINKRGLSRAIMLVAMMGGLPMAVSAQENSSADREAASAAELQQRIAELQAQVDRLAQSAQINNPEPEKKTFGETEIQIGGFVKVDSAFSQYSDGSSATASIGEDFLVPSTIPIGGEGGDTKYHSHAKASRLFIKSHTEFGTGAINTHLEIDAMAGGQGDERISNSYAQRLRHAYVDWQIDENRSLLAGQSWSTFFNVGALPEGLDFVGPVGTIFERQPQVRYSQKIGSGQIQFAAENPASTLYNGTENPYDDNATPDFVVRYNNSIGDLSYSAASMSRELAYESGTGMDDSRRGYAISLAGKLQLGRDDIRFMYSYGNALGRYLGLNSYRAGIIDADGDIELIDQHGGFVALRHFWSDQWRSNLVLSATSADNPGFVSDTTPTAYQSAQVNLMYSPVPKLSLGGEYIYAQKEIENGSGLLADDSGDLQRLQFSMKYVF